MYVSSVMYVKSVMYVRSVMYVTTAFVRKNSMTAILVGDRQDSLVAMLWLPLQHLL
jgi:hypothetical protein